MDSADLVIISESHYSVFYSRKHYNLPKKKDPKVTFKFKSKSFKLNYLFI